MSVLVHSDPHAKVVEVKFTVKISNKVFNRIVKSAEEEGYGYNDAGPLETVRRHLVNDGLCAVFPEDRYQAQVDWSVV